MVAETLPDQLVWLLHKSRGMVASREVATLVDIALDALLQLTQAERAFYFDLDPSSRRPVMHSGKSQGGEALQAVDNRVQSAVSQALADKRSIIVTDSEARSGDESASRTLAGVRAKLLCCLPLLCDGEPIGILYADGKNRPDHSLPTRVLELLSEHVAVCLDNARMFERATGDLLTGLPNNSYFLFHLGRAVQLAAAERQGGVLMLDVDAFKRVNVAAGAEMGDRDDTTPDDIEDRLKLPLLGTLPVSANATSDAIAPKSALSEAFSSIRTNLSVASQDGMPQSIMLTSTSWKVCT
ncbi:MAG: diguanylate cyclase, partial [Deltaproteobacteria bacterium]